MEELALSCACEKPKRSVANLNPKARIEINLRPGRDGLAQFNLACPAMAVDVHRLGTNCGVYLITMGS